MISDLTQTWTQFQEVLKRFGNAYSLLNPPCAPSSLSKFDDRFPIQLPEPLKTLLAINNGQEVAGEGQKNGIFKSVSGWDVYERHVFLPIEGIETAYKVFVQDTVLLAEFGRSEIPFAVAGTPSQYSEAFCIDAATGAVSLLWTAYRDPFNPPEWQVERFKRADSLASFIEKQIELYR